MLNTGVVYSDYVSCQVRMCVCMYFMSSIYLCMVDMGWSVFLRDNMFT